MSILDTFKETITQRPSNLKKPHFYKADSDAEQQLQKLKDFYEIAPSHVKPDVERDINMLSYGIAGEKNVAFELSNSFLPIIVLHDLSLEYEDLTAQIDYLIITPKVVLVVECKNLVGNIEVNNKGDFIRTVKYGRKYHKEGIYSPITQNRRHLDMIKAVRKRSKGNFLTQAIFEKYFDDNYKSVVVLANPKTIINLKYAKKEVKDQIIRADQLIEHLKNLMNKSKNETSPEKHMYDMADFFLRMHKPKEVDYLRKYGVDTATPEKAEEQTPKEKELPVQPVNIEETPVYKALKKYRYETSKQENIKAYYIYNNAQMEELISVDPTSVAELNKISGFGEAKCQKYGAEILRILKEHQ